MSSSYYSFYLVPTLEQLEESVAFIKNKCPDFKAVVGFQLGTGSNELADNLDETPKPVSIPYADIPHFPVPSVAGHSGNLICGYFAGIPVICLQGRVHYYEGYDTREIAKLTEVSEGTVRSRLSRQL